MDNNTKLLNIAKAIDELFPNCEPTIHLKGDINKIKKVFELTPEQLKSPNLIQIVGDDVPMKAFGVNYKYDEK